MKSHTLPPLLLLPLCLLSACASPEAGRIGSAASTPLNDLNLVQTEIPAVLATAHKQPYGVAADFSCSAMLTEVKALDEALGPDIDAPGSEGSPGWLARGTDLAGNTAIGAIQRTAEGLVPFRSWVRKLSGAERHSKQVAAAIAAGSIRRAFIKGWGAAQGCKAAEPMGAGIAQAKGG